MIRRLRIVTIWTCIQLCLLTSLTVAIGQDHIDMADRFQINKDGSYVNFKTTMAGFPVIRGSLKAYQATIFYNPEDAQSASATIRIGVDGISTAHDRRDATLQGPEFLNSEQFPAIWFQSDKAVLTDNGLDLVGTLNIKNINKPITVHLEKPTIMRKAMDNLDLMFVKGTFTIDRKDFDLGTTGTWGANPMLGDNIEIEFTFMCFSYTIDYLKASYVRQQNGNDHPVGLIYQEVKNNGVKEGKALVDKLSKMEAYKSDNWSNNLANIGWILMVDGLGQESLSFYEMALKHDPAHLTSLLRLGDAYVIAKDYKKALAHYKQERDLPARAKFTHIPHMIKLLGDDFYLKNMK